MSAEDDQNCSTNLVKWPTEQQSYVATSVIMDENDNKELRSAKFNMSLTWTDLKYVVNEFKCFSRSRSASNIGKLYHRSERIVLHSQSGQLESGCLTAVIGKSGSGKSTLLESLTGRRTKGLNGQISVNIDSNIAYLIDEKRIKVAFVPQRDDLLHTLTVSETLSFATKLRNRDYTAVQHKKLIKQLLTNLDLNTCKKSYVKRCSGGERKRLSIAMELVSKPTFLIIDEPTSGLDSMSALECIKLLLKLTQSKSNPLGILASIHQPSATLLYEFHNLYVLSYNGYCLFNGPVGDLLPFFEKFNVPCPQYHNPADHVLELASGDHNKELIDAMAQYQMSLNKPLQDSDDITEYSITSIIKSMSNHSNSSLFSHCFTLIVRTLKTTFRDPITNRTQLIQTLFVAMSLILLYGDNVGKESGCLAESDQDSRFSIEKVSEIHKLLFHNIGVMVISVLFIQHASIMTTVLAFPLEMSIFLRERTNGWYSCLSYYLAKTIADFPFLLSFTALYASMIYFFTGQIYEIWRYVSFVMILSMVSLIGQSIGMNIGAIFLNNVRAAASVAPVSTLPFVIFSGFFLHIPYIPKYLQIFALISPIRYAFEACVITIYGFHRCDVSKTAQKESINDIIFGFLQYLSDIGLNYSTTRPLLRALAISKNASLTKLDSFDYHFENISMSQFNIMEFTRNESLAMQQYNLEDNRLYANILTLMAMVIFTKSLTYFILLFKANRRK